MILQSTHYILGIKINKRSTKKEFRFWTSRKAVTKKPFMNLYICRYVNMVGYFCMGGK